MAMLKAANLGLAFVLEVLMLVAFGYWGFHLPLAAPWPWFAAAMAVAIGIALWAVWGAPKSSRRLTMPALLWFKIAMFGMAALALWAAGVMLAAIGFAAVSAVHLALAQRWGQV